MNPRGNYTSSARKRSTTGHVARWLLAAALLFAGALKLYLVHADGIVRASLTARVLGPSPFAHAALAGAELIVAAMLAFRVFVAPVTLLTIAFLSAGASLIAIEMTRPLPVPCGCLGQSSAAANQTVQEIRAGLRASLARNVLLIALGGWVFLSASKRVDVDQRAVGAAPTAAA